MRIKIYVEGGGDTNRSLTECRKGFSAFFARVLTNKPKIRACGGRDQALKKFFTAVRQATETELPLLLVDSEAPLAQEQGVWEHLKARDGWDKPAQVKDDQTYLMVQCMESWFLADQAALGRYFGQGFRSNALPPNKSIESIPKKQLLDSLDKAAKETAKKGYDKGSHSFKILARIDPDKVAEASPHAKDLLDALRRMLDG